LLFRPLYNPAISLDGEAPQMNGVVVFDKVRILRVKTADDALSGDIALMTR
jgi:hypothetical protein